MPNWCGNSIDIIGLNLKDRVEGIGKDWQTEDPVDWQYLDDVSIGGNIVENMTTHCLTAWSPPLEALEAFAEANPDLQVSIEFEESGNDFAGTRVWKGGKLIEETNTEWNEYEFKRFRDTNDFVYYVEWNGDEYDYDTIDEWFSEHELDEEQAEASDMAPIAGFNSEEMAVLFKLKFGGVS